MVTNRSKRARPCPHTPQCPDSNHPRRLGAVIIAAHREQGWHLLCNGIVIFDDSGYLCALADLGTESRAAHAA